MVESFNLVVQFQVLSCSTVFKTFILEVSVVESFNLVVQFQVLSCSTVFKISTVQRLENAT